MFKVLFVCTGNICRSPMAEYLFREGIQERFGAWAGEFVIASAGTHAMVEHPMQEHALDVLKDLSIDGRPFRAKQLEDYQVEGADLVLTATRVHRGAAATLHPASARKSFTLREFDRLLSVVDPDTLLDTDDPTERAHSVVKAAAAQRGMVRPDKPADDDVTDPYQGPRSGYVTCAVLLHKVLERPLDYLAG